MWLIYKHTNKINGKVYIGQTKREPNIRWKNGRGYITDQDTYFSRAIKKYGWTNFSHEIIENNIETQELANERESYYIIVYNSYIGFDDCNGYNMTLGGQYASITIMKPVICIETQEIYESISEAAEKYNCDPSGICAVCKGKVSYIGGYHWAYNDDETRKEELKEYVGCAPVKKKREVICIETQETYSSIMDAEKVHKCDVMDCLNDGSKTAGGYHWAYLDDLERQEKLKKFIGKNPDLKYQSRKIICIETQEIFNSLKEAHNKFGKNIWNTLNKSYKSIAYGYHWSYLDDLERQEKLKFYIGKSCKKEPIICYELNKEFISVKEASEYTSISEAAIKQCLKKGYEYKAGNYHWYRKSEENNFYIPETKIINSKEVMCWETKQIYKSMTIAEKETGCSNISACCRNWKLTCSDKNGNKLHWLYLKDKDIFKPIKKKLSWNVHEIINLETNERFEGISIVLNKYQNISRGTLFRALKDQSKIAGGYHWKYVD